MRTGFVLSLLFLSLLLASMLGSCDAGRVSTKLSARRMEVITGTDSDSFLILYGTASSPARAHLRVGLSAEAEDYAFYFADKKLVCLRITSLRYAVEDQTIVYDESKLTKTDEQAFYFQNGRLVSRSSSGDAAQKSAGVSDGKAELRLAAHLLRHWGDSGPLDLENWIKKGRLDD